MLKFKRNQKWKTRDGRLAVIDTVRGSGHHCILGRIKTDGKWLQGQWLESGAWATDSRESGADLIAPWPKERKPRREMGND